jgi:hypothetical protein
MSKKQAKPARNTPTKNLPRHADELSDAEYWKDKVRKSAQRVYYLRRSFPVDVPDNIYLVHNQGGFCCTALFGTRSWLQASPHGLVRCHCDYGGTLRSHDGRLLTKSEVPKHYRVHPRRAV